MTNIASSLASATELLTQSSESAHLDAEVLLCHVLDKPRSHLRAWPEKELLTKQCTLFNNLVQQRQQGHPVAYLTGSREFWSRDFEVNSDVLIPRPDTELLIELSLDLLSNITNPQLIDLGTGSGAIAITLAAERTDSTIIATDLSNKALNMAQKNAKKHQVNNIQFLQSNWFSQITEDSQFDLIISNPPYIDGNDPHLSQGDVRFEPESALIADNLGLKDIQTLCDQARQFLKPNAVLLIEHGYDQKSAVQTIFNAFNYRHVKNHTDLSGNPRVTSGQWTP